MNDLAPASAPHPDVSVLVLTYNHAPFIAECLDSLLAQDYSGRVEILVGEDCSTDGTTSIVDHYRGTHPEVIHVITAPTNVGMHENNRRLIRAARGRFIAYCEGDDYWHRTDKLRLQVEFLESHPDVVGVHSDVDVLRTIRGERVVDHQYWAVARPDIPDLLRYADLVASNCVQTCTVVLRASILKRYPDSRRAAGAYPMEDWPMFLHMLEHGPIATSRESLATYRQVPGSATRRDPAAMIAFLLGQRQLVTDAAGGRSDLAAERRAGLEHARSELVRLGLLAGDIEVIREAIASARAAGVPDDRLSTWMSVAARAPGAGAVARLGPTLHPVWRRLRPRRRRTRRPPSGADHRAGGPGPVSDDTVVWGHQPTATVTEGTSGEDP